MPVFRSPLWRLVLPAVVLVSCGDPTLQPLPEGVQTVTGILQSADLSAVRRGSHVILQDGVEVYYAESSLVNLRQYQEKRVTLRGTFEYNSDPQDLPVLVVESVADVEETTKEHSLADINVLLAAPVNWKLTQREGRFEFFIEGEADADPIMVVWQEPGDELPDGGVPIVVDATRATRLVDELSNTQVIAVKRDGEILTLRFVPGQRLTAERLREDFIQVLESVELVATAVDPTPSVGTGALSTPCGGTAGILCPDGYFCDIQDFEENIGRCRKI